MRLLEILLTLANLWTFFVLAVPRLRTLSWTRYSALITVVIASVQALGEGARWQMTPAYALAGMFFLVWLLQKVAPAQKPPRMSWLNRLIAGLVLALGILGMAVSIALPTILPVFHFPHPTGPYAIGTLTYHWVDANRPEVFTADPNDHRELMVQVWYPANADPSSPRAPWVQDADALAADLARFLHVPGFTFGHLKVHRQQRHPIRTSGRGSAQLPGADLPGGVYRFSADEYLPGRGVGVARLHRRSH